MGHLWALGNASAPSPNKENLLSSSFLKEKISFEQAKFVNGK